MTCTVALYIMVLWVDLDKKGKVRYCACYKHCGIDSIVDSNFIDIPEYEEQPRPKRQNRTKRNKEV